jgi:uncharacterized protein involved in response to NO
MSRIKWFLKTLVYGFGVFIALSFLFTALLQWPQSPLPLIIVVVGTVGYIGYRLYQGYEAGREE